MNRLGKLEGKLPFRPEKPAQNREFQRIKRKRILKSGRKSNIIKSRGNIIRDSGGSAGSKRALKNLPPWQASLMTEPGAMSTRPTGTPGPFTGSAVPCAARRPAVMEATTPPCECPRSPIPDTYGSALASAGMGAKSLLEKMPCISMTIGQRPVSGLKPSGRVSPSAMPP